MKTKSPNILMALVLALAFGLASLFAGARVLNTPDASAQSVARGGYQALVWQTSTALTASGNTPAATNLGRFNLVAMQLNCPTVTGTSPSLTLKMQGSFDGGATWQDLQTFTALTASGNAFKVYSDVNAASAQMVPDQIRGSYTISGTTPSFTCTITGAAKN